MRDRFTRLIHLQSNSPFYAVGEPGSQGNEEKG